MRERSLTGMVSWTLQLVAALILLQTLFFKFPVAGMWLGGALGAAR